MEKKKNWKKIVLSILVVLILFILILPRLININRYKPYISDILTEKLNRKVEIDNLGLSLITGGSITADGFRIKDPLTIDGNILSVPHARCDVAIVPLLFGKIKVRRVVLNMPSVNIIKYPDGSLNIDGMARLNSNISMVGYPDSYDSGGKKIGYTPPRIVPAIYTFGGNSGEFFEIKAVSIRSVKITGGILTFYSEDPPSEPKEIAAIKGIDIDIDTISIPKAEKTEGGSNLTYDIGERGLRRMLLNASAEANMEISRGTIKETLFSHLTMKLSKDRSSVKIEKLDLDIFKGDLSVEGVFHIDGKSSSAEFKINASGMRSEEVMNAFSDEDDLIVGDLELSGEYTFPISSKSELVSGIEGKGDISITDGYIPDFSLAQELYEVTGIPKETFPVELDSEDFDYMGGRYFIGAEKLFTDKFVIETPAYDLNTSGYMGFDKTLNFAGDISPRKEIKILSVSLKDLAVIPFILKGTIDDVDFSLDIEKIALQNMRKVLVPLGVDVKVEGDIGDVGGEILKEILKK